MELLQNTLPLVASIQAQAAEQASGIHPIVTALVFVAMLVVLVIVHELGHFLTALWMGIPVEEFGIGFPPRAVTLFRHRGVAYTLNWVPLGGFVRFGGEDNTMYGTGSLAEAPPHRKIPVMLAGPLMNLFLAVLIFTAIFTVTGSIPEVVGQRVIDVFPGTPAAAAGFQSDDVVKSLAGEDVRGNGAIRRIAERHPGEPIQAVVERAGEETTLTVTPGPVTAPDGTILAIGLGFRYSAETIDKPANILTAFFEAIARTVGLVGSIVTGFASLIGGLFRVAEAPAGGLTGPIGIARATDEVIQELGFQGFLNWMALLSINLFFLNLLPIPALDGSHIVFSLIEWARGGKKVSPEKESLVHAIGFASLMLLIVVVSVNDVINAISNNPVLGP